ncbi:phosphoglucomutase 1 [Phellopilus nigrolimitatus]|nr:phosphoglucomutase 1 [Phellopilus nigrolimitatus]
MDDSLQKLVSEWLQLDKNEHTLGEVKDLVSRGDIDELERRMRKRIEFGTAGLRGKMEAGWSRMNDLIIIQTSQGLCSYTLREIPEAAKKGIVVGHDHRYHSREWAELVAMVFLNKGFKVYLHRGLVHTPLIPFSVSRLGAACGVMITASHNPKQDNGYKVYWDNAVQIISPHDSGIAKTIQENLEPFSWDIEIVQSSPLCVDVTDEIVEAYFASLEGLSLSRMNNFGKIKFVNTSMHGVSHIYAVKAFEAFGLAPFVPVKVQQDPDPEFPTVKFPNPEEKGVLDLAFEEADVVGASYVLAQDPDADRFSAAEKGPDGTWIAFTGDQLGAIFAARCLNTYLASGKPLNKLAMVASTVSSRMIEAMAAKEGFTFVECLTGFKYIGNTAQKLVEEGYDVPFGYEEAIGFMIGSIIRDKDGISATACFAELAVSLAANGTSVSAFLKDLYNKYGHFKTANSYFVCHNPAIIDRIFARLRAYQKNNPKGEPGHYPDSIAGSKITSVRDLTIGYDSTNPPTFKPLLPLSSGHMIQFKAQVEKEDTKITLTIRTSGTEPKIKYYLEGSGRNIRKVEEIIPKVVTELRDVWMEAGKNGLHMP